MIIDHVDHLELGQEAEGEYANELNSLAYLGEGLWFLYRNVRRIEDKVIDLLGKDVQCSFVGSPPGFEWIPQGLVACSFHWYAVSLCNYLRLVGWLAYGQKPTEARAYARRVAPNVVAWRNKVGAHFARTDPRPEDGSATLSASVMFPVGFENGTFVAHPFTLVIGNGKGKTTSVDMRWSLSRIHRALAERYWPGRTP
jgi:hypothetical protein